MNKTQLKNFKKLLEERKTQIARNIKDSIEELNGLRDSGATDEFDFATINADTLLEQSLSNQQQAELNDINRAIGKILDGSYGICDMCEEKIDIERLKVKPHARYCIVCREIIEKTLKKG